MDPASIAGLIGTCWAILTSATGFISGVNDLRSRYKDVETNSNALIAQTGAVRSAARSIRKWLDRDGATLDREERKSIRDSLEACGTIINSMLDGVRDVLSERSKGSTRWKFWDKVKFLCDQDQMDLYAVRLGHQVAALSLHLHALNLPNSSARRERLRSPEGRAIIRNGITAASSISESLDSWSPLVSVLSTEPILSRIYEPIAPSALTAENLALIDTEEEEPGPLWIDNGGPNNEVRRVTKKNVMKDDKGKQPEPASPAEKSQPDVSQTASDIRSSLDEIRSVIAGSATGESSKQEVKTTLERLTDLMKKIGRILRSPYDRSGSEIAGLDKEANELFNELAEVLRNFEEEAEAPIFSAVEKGDIAEINRILDGDVDVQVLNNSGRTALHVAVRDLKIGIVRALLRKGWQLEAQDQAGQTAIHTIDFELDSGIQVDKMVDCLLKAGANAEATVVGKGTVLHRAVHWGHLGTVDFLLVHGVDIEARLHPGLDTPLHLACTTFHYGSSNILKRLLEVGANPRAETSIGKTPLSLACLILVIKEKALKSRRPLKGHTMSTLYWPCIWFRQCIDKILALLERLDSVQIEFDPVHDVRKSYVFRNVQNWESVSRDYLRYEMEDQRVFALMSSDEVVYSEIRDFYETGRKRNISTSVYDLMNA